MKNVLFVFGGLFLLAFLSIFFSISPVSSEKLEDKALSLKEALGQTLLIGFKGKEMTLELETFIKKIQPGGVLLLERNIDSKEQVKQLVEDLKSISSIPLFVAVDQEGGIISRIPWVESTSQTALQSSRQAFAVGELRGKELHELGINMNLAPVLDSQNPEDFLFERTFQKKETESAEYARSLILGHMESGVFTVVKHYPGYGGIVKNPELQTIPHRPEFPNTNVFERLFTQTLIQFLMLSHVIYEDVDEEYPLPLSLAGMDKVRNRVGNETIIVSDDLLSEAFLNVYDLKTLGTRAVYSGVDILLVAGYPDVSKVEQFYDEFLAAAKEDDTLAERIQDSAKKIFELKLALLRVE